MPSDADIALHPGKAVQVDQAIELLGMNRWIQLVLWGSKSRLQYWKVAGAVFEALSCITAVGTVREPGAHRHPQHAYVSQNRELTHALSLLVLLSCRPSQKTSAGNRLIRTRGPH